MVCRQPLQDRGMWGRMRMTPTDLSDINAHTYTYLINGVAPAGNWTGLFRSGEKVLLTFHQRLGDDVLRRAHSGLEDDRGGRRRPLHPPGDGGRVSASRWRRPST
jgi:hypothetical protein